MSVRFILGLDCETTGLDCAKGDRIIEFAGLAYGLDGVRITGMVQRFDPERGIAAKAQAVHGISYDELVGMPKFATLASKVRAYMMAATRIVIHNAPFDLAFIFTEFKLAGVLRPGDEEVICAKVIDTAQARWATPLGKTPNLGELCFAMGQAYDPAQAHGAGYDVACMMNCYFEGVRRGWFEQVPAEPLAVAA